MPADADLRGRMMKARKDLSEQFGVDASQLEFLITEHRGKQIPMLANPDVLYVAAEGPIDWENMRQGSKVYEKFAEWMRDIATKHRIAVTDGGTVYPPEDMLSGLQIDTKFALTNATEIGSPIGDVEGFKGASTKLV